jgi:hypothetical protein
MRNFYLTALIIFFVLTGAYSKPAGPGHSSTGTVSTVGPGQDFQTLADAFTFVRNNSLTADLTLTLMAGYSESATGLPLNVCDSVATAGFHILIYPTVSGLMITQSNSTGTLKFNGGKNITIDGRVNATGSTPDLQISNTGGGYTMNFTNYSSNNNFLYCIIKSNTSNSNSAAVLLGTSPSGPASNDHNSWDHCIFTGGGTHYFLSNTGNIYIFNSYNSISNCEFNGSTTQPVLIDGGNRYWDITGNRFYGNAGAGSQVICILSTSGYGFNVSNNIIGFANAAGTGMANLTNCQVIKMIVDTTIASNIDGNLVTGISGYSQYINGTPPGFVGIFVVAGKVNIGSIAGNTIGAATGTGAIQVTMTNFSSAFGIYSATTGKIENNTVGSINLNPLSTTDGFTFSGIEAVTSTGISPMFTNTSTIRSNTIGSATTPNSIKLGTDAINTGMLVFNGVRSAVSNGDIIIGEAGAGNTVRNVSNFSNGTNASFNGIVNQGSATSLTLSDNQVSNCSFGWTTAASTGTFIGVNSNGANPGITEISGNNISGHSLTKVTGPVYGMNIGSGAPDLRLLRNTVSNLSKTSGVFYGIYLNSLNQGAIDDNNVNNLVSTGGPLTGIYMNSNSNLTCNGDTVTNLSGIGNATGIVINGGTGCQLKTSLLQSIAGTTSSYGISILGAASAVQCSNNNINAITSTTSGAAIGINANTSPNAVFDANRIFGITGNGTTGSGYGMLVRGTNITITNNLLSGITAPVSNLTTSVYGINALTADVKLYFNSILLNTSSTGTTCGATGLTVSTTNTLDLRNNIIINNSVAKGTGRINALQFSSTALTGYDAASNNNALYAGTPSAANLMLYDGTTGYQTLANFQARVTPRDAVSVTENVSFISTDGNSADFLHIDPATVSQLRQAGTAIPGYTMDYDGQPRSSTPDIGGDEFVFVVLATTFTGIHAEAQANGHIALAWHTAAEAGIGRYELQRSSNGYDFSTIKQQSPTNNNGGAADYAYDDAAPFAGNNFYRVKASSTSGLVQYSAVVSIRPGADRNAMTVSPNPVDNKRIVLRTGKALPGKYDLQLVNNMGQVVYTHSITVTGNDETIILPVNASLSKGSYHLIITGAGAQPRLVNLYMK